MEPRQPVVALALGGSTQLTCRLTCAARASSVQWRGLDTSLGAVQSGPNSSVLSVHNASLSAAGTRVCVGSCGNSTFQKTVQLLVFGEPPPLLFSPSHKPGPPNSPALALSLCHLFLGALPDCLPYLSSKPASKLLSHSAIHSILSTFPISRLLRLHSLPQSAPKPSISDVPALPAFDRFSAPYHLATQDAITGSSLSLCTNSPHSPLGLTPKPLPQGPALILSVPPPSPTSPYTAFPNQLTVFPVALVTGRTQELACTAHNVTNPEALSLSLLLGDQELERVQALGQEVEEEPEEGEDSLFRVTERWLLPPLGTPAPPTLHCQATMRLPGLEQSHYRPIPGESAGS